MMRTVATKSLVAVAGLGLAFSVGACSSSTTEDNAAFCNSAANLATQVKTLGTLVASGTATIDQIQEQRDAVNAAAQQVADDGQNLQDSVKSDVTNAEQAFESAVSDIPTDQTIKESAPAYAKAVTEYESAIANIDSEVGCGTTGS